MDSNLYRRPEFSAAVHQVLRLDMSLQMGAVTESVTVVDLSLTRGDVIGGAAIDTVKGARAH